MSVDIATDAFTSTCFGSIAVIHRWSKYIRWKNDAKVCITAHCVPGQASWQSPKMCRSHWKRKRRTARDPSRIEFYKRLAHAVVVVPNFTKNSPISNPTVRRFHEQLMEISDEGREVYNFLKSMVHIEYWHPHWRLRCTKYANQYASYNLQAVVHMIIEIAPCWIMHKLAYQKQANVCRYNDGCFH